MKRNVMVWGAALLVALLLVQGAAAADAEVQANVNSEIEIAITGDIGTWGLDVGANTDDATFDMEVDSTDDWEVTILDDLLEAKPAASVGHLAEYDDSGSVYTVAGATLDSVLSIRAGQLGVWGGYVGLTGADQQLETGSAGADQMYDIGLSQPVVYTDVHLTDGDYYRMIVTFNAANV